MISPARHDVAPDTAVQIRGGADVGVRYRSGLTVYDEALVDGRLVGRYWSATGTIKPERHLDEEKPLFELLPVAAFHLRIDDAVLDRNWRWVDAYELPEGRPDARHVAIALAQAVHPITIGVHTRFDGSPFLVRWLEIANTSELPVSLSCVAPFAGLLWWMRGYTEGVPPGGPVFSLGYYEGAAPEEAGTFIWRPLHPGTEGGESLTGLQLL